MYIQFLDQGLHSKLYPSVSCGCNVEGKCVQDAGIVLSRKWLTVGEAVGEGRFCRGGDAGADFEAQVGVY